MKKEPLEPEKNPYKHKKPWVAYGFIVAIVPILLGTYLYTNSLIEQKDEDQLYIVSPEASVAYILGDLSFDPKGFPEWDEKKKVGVNWIRPIRTRSMSFTNDDLNSILSHEFNWYKVSLDGLPPMEDATMNMQHFFCHFEIYMDNGEKIFSYGSMEPGSEIKFKGFQQTLISLPKNSNIKFLYLRFRHPPNVIFGLGSKRTFIGDKTSVILRLVQDEFYVIVFSSMSIFIGIFAIILFLFRWRQRYYSLLEFGLFSLCLGAMYVCANPLVLWFTSNHYIGFFSFAAFFYSFPIMMLVFFIRSYGAGPFKILIWFLRVFLIISPIQFVSYLFTGTPGTALLLIIASTINIIFVTISMCGMLLVAYLSYRRDPRHGLVAVIGLAFAVLLFLYQFLRGFLGYNSPENLTHLNGPMGILCFGIILERAFREREERIKEYSENLIKYEKSLRESELKSLQHKMSPHYLFNSLNTVHALIAVDPTLADKALIRLSDNYRYLVDTSGQSLVPFEEEWKFLEDYLHLHKLRFLTNLDLEINKRGSFENVKIPPLTLQPIVENSFKHGFRTRTGIQWNLKVSAISDPLTETLMITVTDNGKGLGNSSYNLWNRSLGGIKLRLEHYFENPEIEVDSPESGGMIVRILIPWKNKLDSGLP
ncbi:sensor histidine kinase [Leptospira sarikeiensis]|uniref:Signal transduction histidine kinase internal region domain-containing protein n=1 Tax=Leptospira sarikeiensis TaxID=2484943 RepID=A0A4R9K7A9_9LEPT|nr:histidine kinase [Leptospira sarikeiensis]TGL60484.1 hypothetical protein EHQ64_11635 [Leptospira sarikeiensis]